MAEKFLKELGTDFEWKINKDTKKLEYRDLTGPEKLLLFQHINFLTITRVSLCGQAVSPLG